ncbi:MAG: DUF2244 domain-containing protein [Gammaproteobacteria bacterium]|nr:DUF2244 domain-containing protein [Gammaproteobacteria bacterium]
MTAETRIEIAPHCSLTPRGARWFFVSLCVASLSIALPISLLGFWLVLPFAGLELALLAWALREFPRHWAQVRIRAGGSPLHPSRLTVESHGRRHEIGHFLNEQERLGLAARLRRLIGRVDESPPLPKQAGAA